MLHILNVLGASDVYGKIDVSKPAIFGGQVTFTITLNRTCSLNDWQYTFGHAKEIFYADNTTITMKVNTTGKVNNTYTLTLMNATSTYHNTNISFFCHSESQDPVDTVTFHLIGKQKHHNVCMCRK